jgi:WD40 repeat protein
LAAIAAEDEHVSFFDVATGKELKELTAVRAAASPLVFSRDGGTLTTIDGKQTLHFWDQSTGKDRLATPNSHRDSVEFIAFIHAGETLVSGSRDRTIR